jgi:rSAM-associated Gly-rich repeat protein
MKHPKLVRLLTALLPAGTVALSTALAPPAEAAVDLSMARNSADVATRLANVQAAVSQAASDTAIGSRTDPRIQKVWWANGGWGRPGWGNGGGWGWRNGGWGNGGWGNWHPWRNGWGNWHPWRNGGWLNF